MSDYKLSQMIENLRRSAMLNQIIMKEKDDRIEALEDGLREAMEWNWLTCPQDINPDVVDRLTALINTAED